MLKILRNKIIWTVDKKEYILTFSAFIQNYIDNKSPNLKRLSREELDFLHEKIKDYFGCNFLQRIEKLKEYKRLKVGELKNISKKRKLGSGAHGIVYPVDENLIVKLIKNNNKMANTESRIHDFLVKRVLFNKLLYSIPILYQTQLGLNDYIVIERSEINCWEYINKYNNDSNFRTCIKSIIFQVIWSFSILQKNFPGFRHNDLKLDNILLDFVDEEMYLKYGISYFKISNVFVKISDFDYTNIPDNITNPKVADEDSKKFGCSIERCDYYDLHIFLNSLWLKRMYLPPSINTWVCENLPSELRGINTENVKHGRLINPKKHKIKPFKEFLKDPFFDCFKIDKLKHPTWGN